MNFSPVEFQRIDKVIEIIPRKLQVYQAPVVQKLDSAIQLINHCPLDKCEGNKLHYPLDRDLSGG